MRNRLFADKNTGPTRGGSRRVNGRGGQGNSGADAPLMRLVRDGRIAESFTGSTLMDFTDAASDASVNTALVLYPNPTAEQRAELAEAWDLHPVLVEDIMVAHQRPKVERYGDVMFVVARSAHYVDSTEQVKFSEFHMIVRGPLIAVLCQDGRWLDARPTTAFEGGESSALDAREKALLPEQQHLSYGPEAIVYRLIDAIVDGFAPVLRGVLIDKEEIERQVFTGDSDVAQRIYRLSQEVIDMQHIITSLHEVLCGPVSRNTTCRKTCRRTSRTSRTTLLTPSGTSWTCATHWRRSLM